MLLPKLCTIDARAGFVGIIEAVAVSVGKIDAIAVLVGTIDVIAVFVGTFDAIAVCCGICRCKQSIRSILRLLLLLAITDDAVVAATAGDCGDS